ncbi:lariat debranching enzyme [Gonapodya sp. JEL0774]|nr:lariat debranching enzyme [Gonapodya sp. JEL0774]
MEAIACPPKYRRVGTFYKYYSGELRAPIPTVFVGGNHEASNYLWELYHGGWVAPNIYFLGITSTWVGLRKIENSGRNITRRDELAGYQERQPYNESDQRSIYHIRKYNIFRLMQIQNPMDIFLSHDWPRGIANFGNHKRLVARRPFFAEEIRANQLGSAPSEALLKRLRPSYWFSAHLHVKYAALYPHQESQDSSVSDVLVSSQVSAANPDAIDIGLEEDDDDDVRSDKEVGVTPNPASEDSTPLPPVATPVVDSSNPPVKVTKFLALDKCLPGRDFLQVIDVPSDNNLPKDFYYDEEWLAIIKACNEFLSLTREQKPLPDEATIRKRVSEERAWVQANVANRPDGLRIPRNFQQTGAPYSPGMPLSIREKEDAMRPYLNPQTFELCDILSINNKINPTGQGPAPRRAPRAPPPPPTPPETDSPRQKESTGGETTLKFEGHTESGPTVKSEETTEGDTAALGITPESTANAGTEQTVSAGATTDEGDTDVKKEI